MNKPLLTVRLPHLQTPADEMLQQMLCACRTLLKINLQRRLRDKATCRDQTDQRCAFELSNEIKVSKKKK